LSKKDDLIERLKFFSENKNELVRMGKNVNKFVIENFNLTEQNVALLDNIYTLNYEFESESEVELEEEK
jgi:hypothetical protein